jgi:predicted signal transduction protein with EAL and GGDEF domain
VRLADAALCRANASGPGHVAVFDPRTGRTAGGGAVEDVLSRASGKSEGAIRFGPVVDYATPTEARLHA